MPHPTITQLQMALEEVVDLEVPLTLEERLEKQRLLNLASQLAINIS